MKEQIGRVCVKTTGREAGKKCVIIDVLDKNFVKITGPKALTGVRRRRANIAHLSFLPHTLDIRKNASDATVTKALKKTDLTDYMGESVSISPMEIQVRGPGET